MIKRLSSYAPACSSQGELFKAETTWFHVFKAMIDSGDVAKLGPFAVSTYLIIKAHTNFSTGQAFPGIELIAEKSGISERKVKECLHTLEDHGYIVRTKKGRRNLYTLREKIQIKDEQGRPTAVATFDYLPDLVKKARADIHDVLITGDLGAAKIVHIERLVMNVQINQGGINTQVNISDPMSRLELIKDPGMRAKMADLHAAIHARGCG